MIHHIGVFAAHIGPSRLFYREALAPLGIVEQYSTDRVCELWVPGTAAPSLSVEQAEGEPTTNLHLAFESPDRATVDAFFTAATAAGGLARHEPRYWPEYRAYCAFVSDPDGNNVEALHKEP